MEKFGDHDIREIPQSSGEAPKSSGAALAILRRTFLAAVLAGVAVTASDEAAAQVPKAMEEQKDYQMNVVRFIKFFKDKNIEINFYESPAEFAANHLKVDAVKDASKLSRALSVLLRNIEDNYPAGMMAKYGLKKIHLVDNVRMEGEKIGGTTSRDGVVLSLSSDVYDLPNIFNHEYFHFLHERGNPRGDHQAWAKTNPNGAKDYTFRDGLEAIKAQKSNKDAWRFDPRHFAGDYGQNGGVSEDEAFTAEALMDSRRIKDLILRAKRSQTLRTKIIMMTGCNINERGEFINIAEDQYKSLTGLSGWRYYAQWSIGQNGLRAMDQAYWNLVVKKADEEEFARELMEQDQIQLSRERENRRIRDRAFAPLIMNDVRLVPGKVRVPTIPIR